jgi:hypothetical protein
VDVDEKVLRHLDPPTSSDPVAACGIRPPAKLVNS